MKRSTIAAIALLIGCSAPATQVVYPPLTKETLVGVWEAISVDGHLVTVERIEISKDGASFFAYQIVGSPAANVFRMITCDITDRKISLRFREQNPPGRGSSDWIFEGTGEGTAQDGAMSGNLSIGTPPAASDKKNAFFRKGSWTRAVSASSSTIEEAISKARDEAAR